MIVVDASVIAPALADDDHDGDQARERLTGQPLAAPAVRQRAKDLGIDLADQVADAAGSGPLRTAAREAAGRMRRGVVAYSSVSD